MSNLIENVNGFFWPIHGGKSCRDYTLARADVPQRISKHVDKKNIVIHAGGNVGYYASQYAKIFNIQYVFEPDFINFCCLTLNVVNPNTYKFQSFLGNDRGCFNLEMNQTDCGGHNIGKNPSKGNIPILRIDDLGLDGCDLIHLDCEGFEPEVLKGGMDTIIKYRPIIAVEASWNKIFSVIENIGYNKIDEIDGDWIFKHGK